MIKKRGKAPVRCNQKRYLHNAEFNLDTKNNYSTWLNHKRPKKEWCLKDVSVLKTEK